MRGFVLVVALAAAGRAAEECPAAAVDAAEAALLAAHPGAEGWEAVGDALQEQRQWGRALTYHRKALDREGTALQAVAVATDLKHLLRFDEALAMLQLLPPQVRGVEAVALFEAALLDCSGKHRKALGVAKQLHQGVGADHGRDLLYLEYLDRHLRSVRTRRAAAEAAADGAKLRKLHAAEAAAAEELDALRASLRATGRVGPEQFVRRYTPGLRAQPTYDPAAVPWAEVRAAAAALRREWGALREEFAALFAAGAVEADDECLSVGWGRYEIDPAWRRVAACDASATPTACAMLRSLAAETPALRVLRGGYSTIAAGAHIAPHYGTTNRQLKLHLGLEVPPGGCVQIRVREDYLTYEEGAVRMLDDSFEHEVWNNCTARRTVFQLVFAHPDLPPSEDS